MFPCQPWNGAYSKADAKAPLTRNGFHDATTDMQSVQTWWTRGKYAELRKAETHVDLYSTNELQAVCTGADGGQAVQLELWVNGEKVVAATDTDTPLPTGGVGLVVTTYQTTRASVAEFDNFVVEQVA